MAVVVQCYNCSNILELDEGFRGGVCRCSQCGSLLQVPKGDSSDSRKGRPAAPGAVVTPVQRPNDPTMDPGLSRGQFDPRSPARPAAPSDSRRGARAMGGGAAVSVVRPPQAVHHGGAAKNSRTLLYVAIGLIALVVVGVVIGLAYLIAKDTGQVKTSAVDNGGSSPAPAEGSNTPGADIGQPVVAPGPPTIRGPAFLGSIPLVGPKIVFSIDGGQANMDCFDYVRRGIHNAIGQMAPDQRFIIAVWNGANIKRFPARDWAGKDMREMVWKDFDEVNVHGAANAPECMKKSLLLKADQTIMVTAKFGLTSDMAQPALSARHNGQRIDAIKINSEDTDSPLQKLAEISGGKFIGKMDMTTLESVVSRGQ